MDTMSKKFLLACVMAGFLAVGTIPALAATQSAGVDCIQMANQDAGTGHKGQPPQIKNGEQPPEPPKDENGKPLPPPDGKGMQGQNGAGHDGSQPPEPPKDENGNPLPPPDGFQHGQQNSK